ncbi:antibiotic biosynthesis monooxygenase [Vicingaceae bacterium]|nr:antibiotic biosynthesis monooxygenase [Vicingaceae bacterium]MDB4061711.1 antibiotic biosynthesis monooxygenase [Vicingaceae bacterium]
MIVRIVKLTFREEEIETFKLVLEESKEHIRAFPGVLHLQMLQSSDNPCIFFTYSHWENVQALENYRHSDLFKNAWSKTKPLFAEKAEAWSTDQLHLLL